LSNDILADIDELQLDGDGTPEISKIVSTMAKMLRIEVNEAAEQFEFQLRDPSNDGTDVIAPLRREYIEELLSTVGVRGTEDPSTLISRNYLEFIVEIDRHSMASRMAASDGLTAEDTVAGLKYKVGPATDEFILHVILNFLAELPTRRWRIFRSAEHILGVGRFRRTADSAQEPLGIFDLLRRVLPLTTLQVHSSAGRPPKDLLSLADGYLFQLSYNLDVAVVPQRSLDSLARPERISQMRRSSPASIDAPRRTYVSDLIYHYQLGVSAEGGMLAFLSYYHVLEHWFETVYHDDLVGHVQEIITGPRFSYGRRSDIMSLISKVTKAVKDRGEEYKIDELSALKLTLKKYVKHEILLSDVQSFNPTLADHYKINKVSFADGDTVALDSADEGTLRNSLANRIYKTRNALVHSKDGSKSRFVPFKDDKDLESEVALLRFVAEQVVLNSSTLRKD
jgi:hypothetical protein